MLTLTKRSTRHLAAAAEQHHRVTSKVFWQPCCGGHSRIPAASELGRAGAAEFPLGLVWAGVAVAHTAFQPQYPIRRRQSWSKQFIQRKRKRRSVEQLEARGVWPPAGTAASGGRDLLRRRRPAAPDHVWRGCWAAGTPPGPAAVTDAPHPPCYLIAWSARQSHLGRATCYGLLTYRLWPAFRWPRVPHAPHKGAQ
ncbi:uncharacterized protein LOC126116861 [Schistocerca cancellata]|uniref:uncharacterized protein LOC126116861 n=1 Tax=Schistocerca cancellata TaxID=274614 RepID=UPI0021183CEE|nr:uncharacterized protein LOC126116861 [Schistocerca cancellata]